MMNEIKNYEYNGKLYSIKTVEMMFRIYCPHNCEECEKTGKRNIHHVCRNLKKI